MVLACLTAQQPVEQVYRFVRASSQSHPHLIGQWRPPEPKG